jgi:hypothetical protein
MSVRTEWQPKLPGDIAGNGGERRRRGEHGCQESGTVRDGLID